MWARARRTRWSAAGPVPALTRSDNRGAPMSPHLPAVRLAVPVLFALSLAACDSSTPTAAAATAPPVTGSLAQQGGPPDQGGPPFVRSLNAITGQVQIVGGQNVSI